MMQAIVAVCVAALGSLTIVAYRHPKKHQKLYLVLIIIVLMSMWTMVVFNAAIHWAQSVIWASNVFEYVNASKATYAISSAEIPDWIMGVLPAALVAYIVFLSTFQYLLTNDNSPDDPSRVSVTMVKNDIRSTHKVRWIAASIGKLPGLSSKVGGAT